MGMESNASMVRMVRSLPWNHRRQTAQQNRQAAALKNVGPRFHDDEWQPGRRLRCLDRLLMSLFGLERKPVKTQRAERHLIRLVAYRREFRAPKNFHRRHALHFGQVKLHVLWKAREVGDHEHDFVLIASKKREHFAIRRPQEFKPPTAQRLKLLALFDHNSECGLFC